MKTLCLYYSRTGHTKKAMEMLAELTGADLYEYTDGRDRRGVIGYLGACLDSVKKTYPKITILGNPDMASYDRVLIGMPVWAEGPGVIGRALIRQYKDKLPEDVYFVVTHMAKTDYMKKIRALDTLLGRPAKGYLSLRTKDHDFTEEINTFAANL